MSTAHLGQTPPTLFYLLNIHLEFSLSPGFAYNSSVSSTYFAENTVYMRDKFFVLSLTLSFMALHIL